MRSTNTSWKFSSVGRDGLAANVASLLNGANTNHSIGRAKNIPSSEANPANATREANDRGAHARRLPARR